jgi:cobalt/nickel transport system permease protein
MHIATGFLSPPVWGSLAAASGAAVAVSLAVARRGMDERRVPLMGVLGAFVFAAQMVNFPILPGTSGHLGGGFLLGVLLGPAAGIIAMASVLMVQALVFQDGGVEALGANLLAMGVLPCLIGGGVRRLWLRPQPGLVARGAAVAGGLAAVLIGATIAIVALWMSGSIPTTVGLLGAIGVMDSIHLGIGLVEGAVSLAVIRFVMAARRDAVVGEVPVATVRTPRPWAAYNRRTLLAGVLVAVLIGGVLSYFKSPADDGLEKAQDEVGASAPVQTGVDVPPVVFQEYRLKWLGEGFWSNALAGVAGSLGVLGLVMAVGRVRRRDAHAS